MKTDRFADIIRRKLDSIRPEFSERDWARMQATLKQAGPNPNMPTPAAHQFTGQVARYAVAGAIGTAVFLTTSIWQHYELKRLHHSLEQVTQKVDRLAVTDSAVASTKEANRALGVTNAEAAVVHAESPPGGQNTIQPDGSTSTERQSSAIGEMKRDTIYVDRYVTVPAPASRSRITDDSQLASPYERSRIGNRTAQTDFSALPARPENSLRNRTSEQTGKGVAGPGLPSSSSTIEQQLKESTNTEKLADNLANTSRQTKNQDRASGTYAATERTEKSTDKDVANAAPTERITNRNVSGAESSGRTTNKGSSSGNTATTPLPDNRIAQQQPTASNVPSVANSGEAVQPTFTYETLSSLPMQLSTVHWNELMAQRAKRMRPARTTVVSGVASAAPAVQRVQPTPMRFRVGVGADIGSRIRSVGVYSELLVLNHWSLGVGLSQARFATNAFPGPPDFNRNNPQDFRKQYARGNDPRLAIFNIQQYSTRVQLPVNLGYRIPLSSAWTLQPTVGTNLNLQNRQYISFYQELPFKLGYEQLTANSVRPVELFNNMTFGANVEWQRKHWVAQGGPLVTTPLQDDPGCQQTVTVGLRARVLYQF